MIDDGGLNQSGSKGGAEKWLNSEFILEVETVGYKRKKRVMVPRFLA